ncbi:MAG: DUF2339 domain-containing protein, partial [Victivallales bacterium]|nr:DUF2339 domain-containing protein [Victivallales bacterium]
MEEVVIGLFVFALFIGGLVCFVGSFFILFSVHSNQKKMFQMLSTLLRDVAALKAARGEVKLKAEQTKVPANATPRGEPAKPVEAKLPLAVAAAKVAEKSLREKPAAPASAPVVPVSTSSAPPPLPVKQIETKQAAPHPHPVPPEPSKAAVKPSLAQKPEVSGFERRAGEILAKIWNWIVVGEEFRNPRLSMEYAIASVWLLRVAIFILIVGGGFFVNYSIERGWLGPVARVCGILLVGIGMVSLGCWLANKKYHLIAQGLLGGGIVFMYMGIFAGYSRFKIIEVLPAFALMIAITLVAGVLSVRLNSLLVAIFGLIGGYLTPVLIDTGSGNLPG